MVGELALEGHLTVGLFPKLGYLDGLRRLLQGGADFLDRANANSESTTGAVFLRVLTDQQFPSSQTMHCVNNVRQCKCLMRS